MWFWDGNMTIYLQLVWINTLHFFWIKHKILARVKKSRGNKHAMTCDWRVTKIFWLKALHSSDELLRSVWLREVFRSITQIKSQRIRQFHLYSNSNFSKSSFPISRDLANQLHWIVKNDYLSSFAIQRSLLHQPFKP